MNIDISAGAIIIILASCVLVISIVAASLYFKLKQVKAGEKQFAERFSSLETQMNTLELRIWNLN